MLRMTPKSLRLDSSWRLLGAPVVCKSIKKRWKYVYFLFMDPFGPDTRRHDMHYMCHSMSICHFWSPFFTFWLLSSTFLMKIAPKVTPEFYKIIKICWKNEYIWKTDQSDYKVTLLYRKWPQSESEACKVSPK